MLAAFRLEQPAFLALACVFVVAAVAYTRRAGQGRVPSPGAWVRWGASIGLPCSTAAVTAALVYAGTPAAHGLLLVIALAGGVALSAQTYRRQRAGLAPLRAWVAGAARVAAWTALVVLVARPNWAWVIAEYRRPLLVVLLDRSASMSLSDAHDAAGPGPTRAEIANRAIAASRGSLAGLNELYDVQLRGVGETVAPAETWEIVPAAPLSALAAALRHAAQLRDAQNEPPVAVLLLSDGGENVQDAEAVRAAARALAGSNGALLAVGVGPSAAQTVSVELDPLVVPARLGAHDRLQVPVTARTRGCGDEPLLLELFWNDQRANERTVHAQGRPPGVRTEFDTQPPGPGLHRLTARLTLPEALGGDSFETATIVDVRQDALRVLLVESRPRTEAAFVTRALRGDPRIQVTYRLLLDETGDDAPRARSDPPDWSDYDVVVLGDIRPALLDERALARLADAVSEWGVGLLLAGGRTMFNDGAYARSALERVSPVALTAGRSVAGQRSLFLPTEAGRQHPFLRGLAKRGADPALGARELWRALPPLGRAARLGAAKPLAVVLAKDEDGEPLAVAHEVGRGRCLAAAWEGTWPWALASDAGLEMHRRFWRQLLVWLAHRRPTAWVLTDRPTYAWTAIRAGRRTVLVRAGVTGLEARADRPAPQSLRASLTLRRLTPPAALPTSTAAAGAAPPEEGRAAATGSERTWSVQLTRHGDRWTAELPQKRGATGWLFPGEYELELTVRGGADVPSVETRPFASDAAAAGPGLQDALTARTRFAIRELDLERMSPTANLDLLRQAAELTASYGGSYSAIDELPRVLQRLATTDRRRRVERHAQYAPATRDPWLLLVFLAVALGLEWTVRKRGGLS